MPNNDCNCDITPGYDDTIENRLIKGEELIYYTSKIKRAIAAAQGESDSQTSAALTELMEVLADLQQNLGDNMMVMLLIYKKHLML